MYRFTVIALLAAVAGCGAYTNESVDATAEMPAIETTPVAFNPDNAPVVELKAPGMHCELCAAKVMTTLRETPGVVDVTADAETKVVKVAYTEGGFEEQTAVDAIDDLGFGPEDEAADAAASTEEVVEVVEEGTADKASEPASEEE